MHTLKATDNATLLFYGVVSISWAVLISRLLHRRKSTIPAIPGTSGFIRSTVESVRFIFHGREIISRGYNQDRNGVFRVARLFCWDYLAIGKQRVLELANAPEHVLSVDHGIEDAFQSDYTLGRESCIRPYHIEVIRGAMTRNLGRCFPRIRDEIIHAFDDVLELHNEEWKLVQIMPAALKVVARTSSRLFLDLPLCRDPEYLQFCIDSSTDVFTRGELIKFFPQFLRPIVGPLLSARKRNERRAAKFFGAMVDERLKLDNEYGTDWLDRPNDLVSWLLAVAQGEDRTTPLVIQRILTVNSVAVQTSAMALTNALYDLVTYPEHILPMREEVKRVVAVQGWTKAALGNMFKLDSFVRESQRINAGPVVMLRKVISKDGFTFSDGKTIPYGSFVSAAMATVHQDPANYDNADLFDGFRFSRLREEYQDGDHHNREGTHFFNRHMVSTAPDHVVFGHGQHACPGRFLAATEVKAMLAHMLVNYDMMADTDKRPQELALSEFAAPNP
ncbi:hypothetical protein MVEN_00795600 [Mycena venus]|uniref:Cytochrome P450 n=1 Tax=Mycena venus TaxID=2733690 RepID=A0A8H7D3D0_9AGAR|nr:hypothetical protein MVEN_00795600 [Mycena venus]